MPKSLESGGGSPERRSAVNAEIINCNDCVELQFIYAPKAQVTHQACNKLQAITQAPTTVSDPLPHSHPSPSERRTSQQRAIPETSASPSPLPPSSTPRRRSETRASVPKPSLIQNREALSTFLNSLQDNPSNIISLVLSIDDLNDEELSDILTKCPDLQHLTIRSQCITTIDIEIWGTLDCRYCTNLTRIKASANILLADCCYLLQEIEIPLVKTLKIQKCNNIQKIRAEEAETIDCCNCRELYSILAPKATTIDHQGCNNLRVIEDSEGFREFDDPPTPPAELQETKP